MKNCSFCGNMESTSAPVLTGMEGSICLSCAQMSHEELTNVRQNKTSTGLKKPHEIKEYLDDYVIGQEDAKRTLSVAVYNHYKRTQSDQKVDIQKSNVLLVGPSGSGKTHLIQTLAKMLDIPIIVGDATTLTEAGYIGEDVETLVQQLYLRSGKNIEKTQKGIIYIDEIDKIAEGEAHKMHGGPSRRSVQEALLKMMEDTTIKVALQSGMAREEVFVETKDILFIFGGAFVGLEETIANRKGSTDKVVGFMAQQQPKKEETALEAKTEDFVKYGMIPEFMGRIPIIAILEPLKKEDLQEILTKTKNSIVKQYQALLRMDGVQLRFHPQAIEYIAEEALERKVGARGLKSIIEKQMLQIMFDAPRDFGNDQDKKLIVVTKDMLKTKKTKTS